ncbi:DUF1566 domain-containing protein [Flavobacteriaceae bacterium]|nr:DUF1566 domain-containing protein [Flavobacteriaceae bacterium]
MKNICTLLAAVLLTATTYAQIGINNETPDASAALDITSTTGGLLVPRMTNAQRQAISNPAAGLQVFVTDFEGGSFMFYDGTKWGTLSFTKTIPDAPTIGTASAGIAQATVSFTAPSSNGGTAITSYTATSSPGGITGTLNQAGSGDIIVSGLTNGTAYTFTVTATNAIGTSLASAVSNSITPQVPQVGDFYGDGVVFYIFEDGDTGYIAGEIHGLVCSFSDVATSIEWGCYGIDLPNVPNVPSSPTIGLGAEIGDGFNNTNAILQDCPTAPAAVAARSLGPDWFLPSAKELNQMYLKKEILEAVSGFTAFSYVYWSSTENVSLYAWLQNFDNGNQGRDYKFNTFYVRAVRAF